MRPSNCTPENHWSKLAGERSRVNATAAANTRSFSVWISIRACTVVPRALFRIVRPLRSARDSSRTRTTRLSVPLSFSFRPLGSHSSDTGAPSLERVAATKSIDRARWAHRFSTSCGESIPLHARHLELALFDVVFARRPSRTARRSTLRPACPLRMRSTRESHEPKRQDQPSPELFALRPPLPSSRFDFSCSIRFERSVRP